MGTDWTNIGTNKGAVRLSLVWLLDNRYTSQLFFTIKSRHPEIQSNSG